MLATKKGLYWERVRERIESTRVQRNALSLDLRLLLVTFFSLYSDQCLISSDIIVTMSNRQVRRKKRIIMKRRSNKNTL